MRDEGVNQLRPVCPATAHGRRRALRVHHDLGDPRIAVIHFHLRELDRVSGQTLAGRMRRVPHLRSVLPGEVLLNHATGVDQQPLNQKVGEAGSRVSLGELPGQRPGFLRERFGKHNRPGWGDGRVERIVQGLTELIDPLTFCGLHRDDAHP